MRTKAKPTRAIPDWLVMSDGGVRCLRCGKVETMPLPMPMNGFQPWCEYAGAIHAHCKDVGRVDVPVASVEEWITGHDTGTSSKAIYRHMKGLPRDPSHRDNYPFDPDDFGRCYRLLTLSPDWRARIVEMGRYSTEWAALSLAWDELTALWEEESVGKRAPKLYARMHELHSPAARPSGDTGTGKDHG